MREIKFRGKRVTMVIGCMVGLHNLVEHEVYRVLAKTVGQFTGLTDKNGTFTREI